MLNLFLPQKYVFMIWPCDIKVWGEELIECQKQFATLVMQISVTTPTFVIVNSEHFERARFILPKHINLIKSDEYKDESWFSIVNNKIIPNKHNLKIVHNVLCSRNLSTMCLIEQYDYNLNNINIINYGTMITPNKFFFCPIQNSINMEKQCSIVINEFSKLYKKDIKEVQVEFYPYNNLKLASFNGIYASYSEIFITNEKIIVPLFDCSNDNEVIQWMNHKFTMNDVVGVDITIMLKKGRTLHNVCLPIYKNIV